MADSLLTMPLADVVCGAQTVRKVQGHHEAGNLMQVPQRASPLRHVLHCAFDHQIKLPGELQLGSNALAVQQVLHKQ